MFTESFLYMYCTNAYKDSFINFTGPFLYMYCTNVYKENYTVERTHWICIFRERKNYRKTHYKKGNWKVGYLIHVFNYWNVLKGRNCWCSLYNLEHALREEKGKQASKQHVCKEFRCIPLLKEILNVFVSNSLRGNFHIINLVIYQCPLYKNTSWRSSSECCQCYKNAS